MGGGSREREQAADRSVSGDETGVEGGGQDLGDRRIAERTLQGQLKKRVSKKVGWPLSAETNPGMK